MWLVKSAIELPLVELSQVFGDSGSLFGDLQVLERTEVLELGEGVSSGGQQVDSVLVEQHPEGFLMGDGHRAELVFGGVHRALLLLPELGVGVEFLARLELLVLLQNKEGAPGLEIDLLAPVVHLFRFFSLKWAGLPRNASR